MDHSGLSIPIGGSEPLSAVLLELSSQGTSRFTNPTPSRTMATLLPPQNMVANPNVVQTRSRTMATQLPPQNMVANPNVVQTPSRTMATPLPPQNMVANPNVGQMNSPSYIREGFQQTGYPITNFPTSYHTPALSPYASFGTMNAGVSPNIIQNNRNQILAQPQGQHSGVFQQTSRPSHVVSQDYMNLVNQTRTNNRDRMTGKRPRVEHPGLNYSGYKPGTGVQRLNQYMFTQKNRPKDNNINFWKNFVTEYFAPRAKKSWCVSSYKNRYQIGEDLKVARQCEMCHIYPCYGFEINEDLLPVLHKIKYDNGVLDEHLHFDAPTEYVDAYGQITLHFAKAIEETEYRHTHVARLGQLRVVFSPDLKICSWEFCARHHENCIPTNSSNPQAGLLGNAVQNNQTHAGGDFSVPLPENMNVSSAYQMVEALGMSYLAQIGIVRRYVQYLQISEMPIIMNEWMDYSLETATTQTGSMANFTSFGSRVPSEHLYQSPAAPYFSASVGPVTQSNSYNRGLSNMTMTTSASASMGPNNQKRQRTGPNNPYVGFSSSLSSSHLNFSCAASTPSYDIRPQLPHTPFGNSGQQFSAPNILHMEPENSPSDVDIYIEGLQWVRQMTEVGVSESRNGVSQNSSNALANIPNYDGSSSRPVYIDVENYVVRDNGASSSAVSQTQNSNIQNGSNDLANITNYDGNLNRTVLHIDVGNSEVKDNGASSSAVASHTNVSDDMGESVFPRDLDSNYLPKEYDDYFLGQYMDFGELHDLLK